MTERLDPVAENGLRFFGRISASISHEIKNALAIINENAGLLDDYRLMAEKGRPLDPARLGKLAEKIVIQIRRADAIMGNMNKFAHSADAPARSVKLKELVDLMATLCGRFAANKNVAISWNGQASDVAVTTHPFLLENLVFQCIDHALNTAGSGNAITLAVAPADGGALFSITGLAAADDGAFPSETDAALARALGARLTLDASAGAISAFIPAGE